MASAQQAFLSLTFADGSVGVMGFVLSETSDSGALRWTRDPSPENIEAEIARTAFDAAKLPVQSWRFIDTTELPIDRAYRNAWIDTGKAIVHDMPKARGICVERLRIERNAKLDALDKDWMKASGQKDSVTADAVEVRRQELRDFPATIAATLEAALTIEDLKAITLDRP